MKLTECERLEELKQTKEDLLQDILLLRLALTGAQTEISRPTWDCLLRLTDYLSQHADDLCRLCRPKRH